MQMRAGASGQLCRSLYKKPLRYSARCITSQLETRSSLSVNSLFSNRKLELFHTSCCFTRSAYHVHATEETYTATQLNLAELTKEPSATYQICLRSQRGTRVNRPHHGDIPLRSPWFGIETKNQLVSCTNPATS